jgi:regulator of sigma E protease
MMIVNILIGLVGLGIVVFFHELGHLIAAKSVGIEVEAFALGWGKKLVGYTWRGTEYRIAVFPVGGYCKMKGEQSYATALENNEETIPHESGSFFSAAPWKRVVTLLAGPVANVILAVCVLGVIWWVGYDIQTYENRIVVARDYPAISTPAGEQPDIPDVATRAGLETGDYIVAIDGEPVNSYRDIEQAVVQSAQDRLELTVARDGQRIPVALTPEIDRETGAGQIGIQPWIDPIIARVMPDSPAAEAGIRAGDRILSINGAPTPHSVAVVQELSQSPPEATVTIARDGRSQQIDVSVGEERRLGIEFALKTVSTPDYNIFQALGRGATQSVEILVGTVRGLGQLFGGEVQLRSAVAGPIRISYEIGNQATAGLQQGLFEGFMAFFRFISLLSVVLFFMNLLPIPVLDGGQIVLSVVEWVRNRQLKPRTVQRYQMVGGLIVIGLLVFAVFSDILFVASR